MDRARRLARDRSTGLRAVVLLLHDSGMRVFELAGTRVEQLRQTVWEGRATGLWGELRVVGKERWVPVSVRAHAALVAHRADRDLTAKVQAGALLAPLDVTSTPRAQAKAALGREGYCDRGLRHLVDRAGHSFRGHLAAQDPALLARVGALHPHAFRHAFGTHATETGVPVDVLQRYMGHATPATTVLHNKAGVRRRQAEIGKLFRQIAVGMPVTGPPAHTWTPPICQIFIQ
ncbi:site-specific integrase [Cupriavidus necator]